MKTTLFCFSATGNSLYVAKKIAGQLENTRLVLMNHISINELYEESERVGFIFPVYFMGIPNLVRDFIKRLNISEKTYYFSIATMGGSDFLSHLQINALLEERGAKLSYSSNLLLPGNYQILYDVPNQDKQEGMFKKVETDIEQIVKDISLLKEKQTQKHSKLSVSFFNLIYQNFYSKPGGRDYHFRANENCIHCELCAKVCPVNNIQMQNGLPGWKGDCQECLACLHWCPKEAIQYKKITARRKRYHHPKIKIEEIMPKK